MDVLSPLDAAFLRLESHDAPMHIASAAVFDGPAPSYEEFLQLVRTKLPLLPRYRQRVQEVPLWLGRPVWVDDTGFNATYHVRHTAIPHPGTTEQLRTLCARVLSQPLDRGRPLWEAWLVEGLEGDRWALLSKVHHCMVDGIAGTDLLSRLLDPRPDPAPPAPDDWQPTPGPGLLRLLSGALPGVPRPGSVLRGLTEAARHPNRTRRELTEDARGLRTWAGVLWPASRSSLTGPITSHRGWGWASASLDDVRQVRHAFGGTVNDVVLTLVTSAFRDLLLVRGEEPGRHTVRSLVPVSVRPRHADDGPMLANRVSAMVAELPVHLADPVERLTAVRAELDRLKRSGEAQFGEALTEAATWAPPVLLSAGLFGGFRLPQRQLVTVTTNVPGPTVTLWGLGRRLREMHPFVPIADRVRTGVAVTSYEGLLSFGVTVDADSTPDLDVLTGGIGAALARLLALGNASQESKLADTAGRGLQGSRP
ncbi:MAG: wax ester/triacylglycerol synthase family O-acyltransferase [Mycobacteriales bacterium]